MNASLPDAKKLISVFIFLMIVSVAYYTATKKPGATNIQNTDSQEKSQISDAYFIPPKSTVEEVSVRGRVVPIEIGEYDGATHKILDSSGKVLTYAVTNDDKLKQQEQSVVTLVGMVPLGTKLSANSLLKVDYISFK